MSTLSVGIKKLNAQAQLPEYAHEGDAGMDLRAAESCILQPFERKLVSCGFALELPEGYAAFVLPRSGLSSKNGITVVNAPGLIDSGYRGEIKVALVNLDSHDPFQIIEGDRIAQMVIIPIPFVTLVETDELSETNRGAGGFGSTGVSS